MYRARVIPVLLCNAEGSLVKTVKFKKPVYVGDPINAVKIFNEKEVDELIFLDITATAQKRKPNFKYLKDVATESFMPLCYGGGLQNINDISEVIKSGIEKVCINSFLSEDITLLSRCADKFGSSATVASIDVKKDFWGKYKIMVRNGEKSISVSPVEFAQEVESKGAGEIMLNSIDKDGLMQGFDLDLIKEVSNSVNIPVIACGGAGTLQQLKEGIVAGASAVAAGSMFVFQGKHRAVLISYPLSEDLKALGI
jgi:cyclase